MTDIQQIIIYVVVTVGVAIGAHIIAPRHIKRWRWRHSVALGIGWPIAIGLLIVAATWGVAVYSLGEAIVLIVEARR